MSRNYNTTQSKPYVRVRQMVIKYGTSEDERVKLSITEGMAIVDADGAVNSISGAVGGVDKVISLDEITNGSFSLINPETGEAVDATMSTQDLYIAMASYVRKLQKEAYPDA